MNQISVLSQETIDKIAAGEVVERPASIVKELVENSIDAGANAVTVEIRDGGTTLIRITDNGAGISREEVPVAFLRHATSKIRTVEDLQTAGTLGFRGEALSSIAAIAQVELITKTAGSLTGTRYVIEGGAEKGLEEIGAPEGTTFLVRNMFYNTPARKKFLKSNTTEAGYISDLIERLALSHPGVSFKFMNQGQTKLHTSGNCRLKDVVYGIYGRDITANLLPVEADCGYFKITGLIGKPLVSRGNRNYENYFVNGRFVRSNIISRAIEEAYRPFMMNHRYPFTVLSLEMDGAYLDANVHPTKMEVRFSDQVYVYEQVYQTVKDTLAGKELIPEISLEKQRTSEKTSLLRGGTKVIQPQMGTCDSGAAGNEKNGQSPEKKAEKNLTFPEPFEKRRREMLGESAPSYQTGNESGAVRAEKRPQGILKPITGNIVPGENTFRQGSVQAAGSAEDARSDGQIHPGAEAAGSGGRMHPGSETASSGGRIHPEAENVNSGGQVHLASHSGIQQERSASEIQNGIQAGQDTADVQEAAPPSGTPTQMELFDDKLLSRQNVREHKLIGQIFDTYWIVEFRDRLYIIDQHAAHEKVMYERFIHLLKTKQQTSQMVSPPLILTLSMQEEQLLERFKENFTAVGFEIEHFGGREYAVSAVPGNLYNLAEKDLFLEMLDGLSDVSDHAAADMINDKIATMSCKAAVKGNSRLSPQEADALIGELLGLENPYNCPHGRPTIISMTKYELEKKFKRIL